MKKNFKIGAGILAFLFGIGLGYEFNFQKISWENRPESKILITRPSSAAIKGDLLQAAPPSLKADIFVPTDREPVKAPPKKTDFTALFLGDIMLDRYVKRVIDKHAAEFPFEKIKDFLAASDLAIANLEGPVTNFKARKLNPNNTTFTFHPDLVAPLATLGFDIFGLGNNHTRDFGKKGFDQTRENLSKNQLLYYGDNRNEENISLTNETNGYKLTLIGYNELGTKNFDTIVNEVKLLRPESDFIIVTPHFGIEYQKKFHRTQQEKAHKLIDAGADMVIATHPHVIQPIEIYNRKAIFYSLGNLLFDQTFSLATQQGLAVKITFNEKKLTFELHPHQTNNFQIELLDSENRQKILDELAKNSQVEDTIKEAIKKGKFEL